MRPSTARTRACRARARRGVWLLKLEIGAELVDALVEAKYLEAWDGEDRAAISAALERLHRRLIAEHDM